MEDGKRENDELAAMIKNGFDEMGRRFDVLEGDVGVLKQDVSGLKQDVGILKQDVSILKQDVAAIKHDMHEGFMKTNDKVDLLAVKLADNKAISAKDLKEVIAINPVNL